LLFVFLTLASLLNLFSTILTQFKACGSQKIVRLAIIKNTLSKCSEHNFQKNKLLSKINIIKISLKNEEQIQPQSLGA